MTEDQLGRQDGDAAVGPLPPAGGIRVGEEGGDPVCWAYLVCDECGAITTEGHHDGCSRTG